MDSFENTQKDFENQLAQIEHDANMTSKNLEMAQARGYLDNAGFYQQLADKQLEQINRLQMELGELNNAFEKAMASGEIEENSEAWLISGHSIR